MDIVDNFVDKEREHMIAYEEKLNKVSKHLEQHPADIVALEAAFRYNSKQIEQERYKRKIERQRKLAEIRRRRKTHGTEAYHSQ